MNRFLRAAVIVGLGTLASFGMVSAHATLDHCTPAVGSTVATAPAQIVCVYSEEIDTKRSTMSVWDANNNQVDKNDAHVDLYDPDHKTLIVSLDPGKVTTGLFTVKWHTVTPDDNGVSDGSWQFVIGSAAATPIPTAQAAQGAATPTATPAATSQVNLPTTGAPLSQPWVLPAILGATVLVAGLLVRVRRLRAIEVGRRANVV